MFKKIFHTIVDWIKNLFKRKKHSEDFVAVAVSSDRVCISGKKDEFTAIKEDGKWRKGYPNFDDLMDNFSEVKDFTQIDQYSSEARIALTNLNSNPLEETNVENVSES